MIRVERSEIQDVARIRAETSAGAMREFSVKMEWPGDSRPILVLTGEVDMYTAPAVERELQGAIDGGAREVIVDLTGASFIDSTLLGVLIGAHKQLDAVGGRVSIVCGDRNLVKLFEITGFDRVFAIRATRTGARRTMP